MKKLAWFYILILIIGTAAVAIAGAYSFLPHRWVMKLPRVEKLDRLRPVRDGLYLGHAVPFSSNEKPDALMNLIPSDKPGVQLSNEALRDQESGPLVGECPFEIPHRSLGIRSSVLVAAESNRTLKAAFAINSVCLRLGRIVLLVLSDGHDEGFRSRAVARARITQLRVASFKELESDVSLRPQLQGLLADNGLTVRLRPVVFVEFELQSLSQSIAEMPDLSVLSQGPWHPYATAVDRDGVRQLLKTGAVLIDVRRRDHAESLGQKDRSRDVLHRPISEPQRFLEAVRQARQLGQAIVVFADGPFDRSAQKAILTAHRHGIREFFWFWEGGDQPMGREAFVPDEVGGVAALSWEQWRSRRQEPAVVIDVRSKAEVLRFGGIDGAIHRPYEQTWSSLQLRFKNLDAELLLRAGDEILMKPSTAEILSAQSVLFVGSGHDDWRAAKAALLQKHRFASVYFLKNGFAEWSRWKKTFTTARK